MVPIGWLIIMLGIAAIIDGFHGKTLWTSLNSYLQSQGTTTTPKTGG